MMREEWWVAGLYRDEFGYYRYDGEMDGATFSTALMHVGRNDGPALLYDLYAAGSLSIYEHPGVVAEAWSMAEFPTNLLPAEEWVELFEEAGYTEDEKPAPRPRQAVTVYRGCSTDRRHGMSWTTDIERARWFADRDLGHGTGLIYVFNAPPESLLAFIHDSSRGEAEYVINPESMNDANVVQHA
jgi:hypothetical protein